MGFGAAGEIEFRLGDDLAIVAFSVKGRQDLIRYLHAEPQRQKDVVPALWPTHELQIGITLTACICR